MTMTNDKTPGAARGPMDSPTADTVPKWLNIDAVIDPAQRARTLELAAKVDELTAAFDAIAPDCFAAMGASDAALTATGLDAINVSVIDVLGPYTGQNALSNALTRLGQSTDCAMGPCEPVPPGPSWWGDRPTL